MREEQEQEEEEPEISIEEFTKVTGQNQTMLKYARPPLTGTE